MKSIAKWLERLSLDAAIVAVVWGIALSRLAGRTGIFHEMLILGLATWLTYVADRLWEVRPGMPVPMTDRHAYYNRHYREFKFTWIAVFGGTVAYAVSVLPGWKILFGWLLVMVIVGYLVGVSRIGAASMRLLFKRVTVPVIFVAGITLMAETWRHLDSIAGSVVLLSAAFSNVLLISYRENRDREKPEWLATLSIRSIFLLLVCSNAALFVHWPVGLAGLSCSGAYYFFHIRILAGNMGHIRMSVDGILAFAGLLLLLL